MNILFSFILLPHLSESGVFVDLIKEFSRQGHNVKVVTPLIPGTTEGVSFESNIEVLRFKTDQLTRNSSNIKKGIAYIKYTYQILFAIRKFYKDEKFDLIIGHSLPPEFALVVKCLKYKYNAKLYLMLCEYVWQDSVSLGFIRQGGLICRYYRFLEQSIIRSADFIGSPSQGNINFTLELYPWAENKNIHILHYPQSPIEICRKHNILKDKYNISNKFTVVYGGNVSIAQKIENVISLAEACKEIEDIVFLIIGRGPQIDKVIADIKNKALSNVIFIDFLPKQEYEDLLSECDVGIVSLNEKLAVPNIPSKTVTFFNLAIPIVASIDYVTDYGSYLEKAGAGFWSYAGDTESFKQNLLKLYNSKDLKKKMGDNGYQFYKEHMTPLIAYNTIEKIIKQ